MLKYSIVEFAAEINKVPEVEIVPQKWISPKKSHSMWPPFKNVIKVSDAVKSVSKPKNDWGIHKIAKILGTFDSYEKARSKLARAEFTSDMSSPSESCKRTRVNKFRNSTNTGSHSMPKKRRQSKQNISNSSDSGSSSEDDSFNVPSPPQIDNEVDENLSYIPSTSTSKNTQSNLNLLPTSYQQLEVNDGQPHAQTDPCTIIVPMIMNTPISSKSSSSRFSNSQRVPQGPLQSPSANSNDSHQSVEQGVIISLDFSEQIMRILESIKLKLDQLEKNQDILWSTVGASQRDHRSNINLPLWTIDDFNMLEHRVTHEEEVERDLTSLLSFIGGTDVGDCTRLTMHKLMTNQVASKFNWAGTHGKKGFKNMKIATIVIGCVFKSFRNQTKDKIEDNIKRWLKQAPQRKSDADPQLIQDS